MSHARSSAVAAAVASCLIASAATAEIKVTRWPDDVPCEAIKKADGGWVLTTTVVQGPITRKTGDTFKDSRIVRYWDGKCGRKP
jgi:hypothetical protein